MRELGEGHLGYSEETTYRFGAELVQRKRLEEAIPFLLDSMHMNKDWEDKKAFNFLMDVFKNLG